MSTLLRLTVVGLEDVQTLAFDVKRVYNLGFTIRDPILMQQHLDEIVEAGIPQPHVEKPPAIFPISHWAITTDSDITVQRERTSGEVEIVILKQHDDIFVGVGSDHTDRELEATDIIWSKQVCPNVVAPTVWPLADVEDHWDNIIIESVVEENGERTLYQRASVADFWTPREMLASLTGRVKPVEGGLVVFSGTVVSEQKALAYATTWTIRMIDPVLNRAIEHEYYVTVLANELL